MIRLTLLAPDIIESILNGTEPDGLSLDKLYQAPVDWEQQRRALAPDEQVLREGPGLFPIRQANDRAG